jgi:hypothetical protein
MKPFDSAYPFPCATSVNLCGMAEPNIADWLTAVGTIGTLVVTVSLVLLDRSKQRKREDLAQAVLISGWADSIKAGNKLRQVHVANMSDEPVYNVNIFLQDEKASDPPSITGDGTLINNRFLSVFPPRQQGTLEVEREHPASPGPNTIPLVALLFTDRNNTRWLRNWDGKVTPAGQQENDHNLHRAKRPSDNIEPLTWEPIG